MYYEHHHTQNDDKINFQLVVYFILFYVLSMSTILATSSVMHKYQCDYTISHKSDAYSHIPHPLNSHHNHSDSTMYIVIAAAISSIVISIISLIFVGFVIINGVFEYTRRGMTKYIQSLSVSLMLSIGVSVFLSIVIGLAIGTQL